MYFCLLFDKKNMTEGLAAIDALRRFQNPSGIFVWAIDDDVKREALARNTTVVTTETLKELWPELNNIDRTYRGTLMTFRPFFIRYCLNQPGVDKLCSIDSDTYFWGDWKTLEEELGSSDFMVVPHNLEKRQKMGYFWGWLTAFNKTPHTDSFIEWWCSMCIEECEWREGTWGMSEQGYLDIVIREPNRFGSPKICMHPGIRMWPHKTKDHKFSGTLESGIKIDDKYDLICFHYFGYRGTLEIEPLVGSEIKEKLFTPYAKLINSIH